MVHKPLPAPRVSDDLPEEFVLLRASLARVPDFRKRQGKLYALPDVLGLVVLGLMANCRSLSAIMRFGRSHPQVLAALGLAGVPSVPTLSRVLAGVNGEELRNALRQFAIELIRQRGEQIGVVAMDGKTLRGVHEGAEPLHLLHLFAQQSAVVLDQVTVGTAKAEVIGAKTWIREMASVFPGLTVLTADALYADRDLCATIVAQDYEYLLKLKKTRKRSTRT